MIIYLHGNCQVAAMVAMMHEQDTSKDLVINYNKVHLVDTSSPAARAMMLSHASQSDVIVTQPIADGYNGVDFLSTSWLKANKRPDARLLTLPSIFFRGYNISSFALNLPGHITDYHDAHIADMFVSGISPEDCFARIGSTSFLSEQFVRDELLACLLELREREKAHNIDLRLSSFLWERYDERQLFHTFNHPSRVIIVEAVRQLYAALGIDPSRIRPGRDHLATTFIPAHPSIARYLGIQTDAAREMIILPQGILSLRDFVRMAYESYAKIGRDEVRRQLYGNKEAAAYLLRFQGHHHGNQSQALVERLYQELLHRSPAPDDVIYWRDRIDANGVLDVVEAISQTEEARELAVGRRLVAS